MASTYSSILRLELIATGEQSGTWGDTTNVNLGTLLEEAIAGVVNVTHDDSANYTLTTNNGAADEARNAVLQIIGTLTVARNVICPTREKLYFVTNSTTGGFAITLKTSGGSGVSIPNGGAAWVYCDGTNVVSMMPRIGTADLSLGSNKITNVTDPTAAQDAATKAYVDARAYNVGQITWHAANTPPANNLECDGSAVSRTTYAALFAVIGTTWGVGDGSTTFNLPNLRGEFVRGWDNGRGVDSGRAFASAQADATDVNGLSATTTATINNVSNQPNTGGAHDLSRGPSSGAVTLSSTDTETRPRNVALLPCIKY